jgi:hypothetical protein
VALRSEIDIPRPSSALVLILPGHVTVQHGLILLMAIREVRFERANLVWSIHPALLFIRADIVAQSLDPDLS